MQNQQDLYLLALLPPEQIAAEVQQFKQDISDEFGGVEALRRPAHITLEVPFRMEVDKEPAMLEALQKLGQSEPAFQVHLDGFSGFASHAVFVRVVHFQPIRDFHRQLQWTVKDRFIPPDIRLTKTLTPHMTVAFRDISPETYRAILKKYGNRHYRRNYLADHFHLLKHYGKEKGWQLYRSFTFSGRADGVQGSLAF